MASPLPSVLIAGHSFVKRLHSDLQCKFDLRAAVEFNLVQTATVSFHGIGGLTVSRLARELRLLFVNEPLPRVVILEIGTNDLSSQSPEVVIGEVLDLVDYLQSVESSTVVSVCKVIPRRQRGKGLPLEDFNNRPATFNKMLEAPFDDQQFIFVWEHFELQSPAFSSSPFTWWRSFESSRAVLSISELQGCYIKRRLFRFQCRPSTWDVGMPKT